MALAKTPLTETDEKKNDILVRTNEIAFKK